MEDNGVRLKALDVYLNTGEAKQKALAYFAKQGMTEADVIEAYWSNHTGPLDPYLYSHNLTRYKVYKSSKISQRTLQQAADKPAIKINGRILAAIATLINKTPGKVLDGLIAVENELAKADEETADAEKQAEQAYEELQHDHPEKLAMVENIIRKQVLDSMNKEENKSHDK